MKKICAIFVFAFALLFCVGCSAGERSLMDYQKELSKVTADVDMGGKVYKIEIAYTGEGSELTVVEPQNISGVKFVKETGATYALWGDMKIPVTKELFSGVDPIFNAFCLPEENVNSITKDESGNTVYTVAAEDGVYTVFMGTDGMPVSIDFEGGRTFSIGNILLQKMT